MKKALIYRISVVVCGSALGLMGLSSVLSGRTDIVSVLLSIGGVGMVTGVVYEAVLPSDSPADVPDERIIWFTTSMALLVVSAGVWSVVG